MSLTNRTREVSISTIALVNLLVFVGTFASAQPNATQPQTSARLKVAFVVSERFNIIDFGGPWEVFNAARIAVPGNDHPNEPRLFETYTVSASTSAVNIEVSQTKLIPDYTFQNAPKPDIIVVGAQDWLHDAPELWEWLRKENADGVHIMSVCIGAGELAAAGLLDGKQATTHHAFFDDYQKAFPKVTWQPGKRYVKSSESIFTSAGLTSGIDLALHVVAERFGENVAQKDAEWLEYTGVGWKQKE